jgi:hypothetical protein
MNELERVYLELLDYELVVSGPQYAKYYFILRTYAERVRHEFPLRPLPFSRMRQLQRHTKQLQCDLRNDHTVATFQNTR